MIAWCLKIPNTSYLGRCYTDKMLITKRQKILMGTINIYNARQNNLKNISLKIPKNKITVFTGVSGSGKSSLVFETIGAEAQRQINETQNSFVRNSSKLNVVARSNCIAV